jgi:hypothetical protein
VIVRQLALLSELDREDVPVTGDTLGAPFQTHSPTSREAAEQIAPVVNRLQRIVLRALIRAGEAGLTDEDIRRETGLGETARPRRIELVASGLARNSGDVRPSVSGRKMAVWVATPAAFALEDDDLF